MLTKLFIYLFILSWCFSIAKPKLRFKRERPDPGFNYVFSFDFFFSWSVLSLPHWWLEDKYSFVHSSLLTTSSSLFFLYWTFYFLSSYLPFCLFVWFHSSLRTSLSFSCCLSFCLCHSTYVSPLLLFNIWSHSSFRIFLSLYPYLILSIFFDH